MLHWRAAWAGPTNEVSFQSSEAIMCFPNILQLTLIFGLFVFYELGKL